MTIGVHFDNDKEYNILEEYETNIVRGRIDPTTDPITYTIYNDY